MMSLTLVIDPRDVPEVNAINKEIGEITEHNEVTKKVYNLLKRKKQIEEGKYSSLRTICQLLVYSYQLISKNSNS